MLKIEVAFYAENGVAPALEWLADQPEKVQSKFRVIVELLADQGSTLSRPYAAPLAKKIYELRVRWQNVNDCSISSMAERLRFSLMAARSRPW